MKRPCMRELVCARKKQGVMRCVGVSKARSPTADINSSASLSFKPAQLMGGRAPLLPKWRRPASDTCSRYLCVVRLWYICRKLLLVCNSILNSLKLLGDFYLLWWPWIIGVIDKRWSLAIYRHYIMIMISEYSLYASRFRMYHEIILLVVLKASWTIWLFYLFEYLSAPAAFVILSTLLMIIDLKSLSVKAAVTLLSLCMFTNRQDHLFMSFSVLVG